MFTGIVQHIVPITQITTVGETLSVSFKLLAHTYQLGDSILVHGICSTVAAIDSDTIAVAYMPETRRCTTVSSWTIGQLLHIESAVTITTALSGWIITGHIDTTTLVTAVTSGDDYSITVALPADSAALVLTKGGITINGVNLTMADVGETSTTVQLVPYTLSHTTLGHLAVGERVNVEFDYVAKLARRYWQVNSQPIRPPLGDAAEKK